MFICVKSKLAADICLELTKEFLALRGLTMSANKTKVTDLQGSKAFIDFVGYRIIKNTLSGGTVKWFIISPPKNIERVQTKLKTL